MTLYEQLTTDDLVNWDLEDDAEDHFTMAPGLEELKQKSGLLRADRIPKQNFHPEDIFADFFSDIYAEPLTTVAIDRRKTFAIHGFVFPHGDTHRYVVARVNKGKEFMFIARIELDVVPPGEPGDFMNGDQASEMNGFVIDTGELLPYAITLQTITHRRIPRPDSA